MSLFIASQALPDPRDDRAAQDRDLLASLIAGGMGTTLHGQERQTWMLLQIRGCGTSGHADLKAGHINAAVPLVEHPFSHGPSVCSVAAVQTHVPECEAMSRAAALSSCSDGSTEINPHCRVTLVRGSVVLPNTSTLGVRNCMQLCEQMHG
jgi:hypothetical protein